MGDRYTVISADCHAGGQLQEYRAYLEPRYRDEFDAWAATYEIPYDDLKGPNGSRNWDSARRRRELEDDGIVAEVIYPNTVPPFYPKASLALQPATTDATELARRWAGLQAHNRWLADFCADAPGRRAGIAQVTLHDPVASAAEVRWARGAGLRGVLLPGAPPGSGLPPLYDPVYEPIWLACEETGLPVHSHSGSAVPDYGDGPVDNVMFLVEVTWWANRNLWHLVFGGVLERHPGLHVVFTEQGTAWVPERLATLDYFHGRMAASSGSQEEEWGREVVGAMSLTPSGYWRRQCHLGSSFIRPAEVPLRHAVGIDKIMWGSDYPHRESSFPYSRLALRLSFAGVDPAEVRAMVGGNAAALYGFDLDALQPIADRVGPTVEELATPVERAQIPSDADRCPAFAGAT